MSQIYKTRLKNGLKIITEEMPDIQSASIGIWVNIGSRNEDSKKNGISHFIEHLLFKGTEKRTALDIAREIESVGGVLNAFTGRENTCFYAKVLSKDIPLAVDLLSDIFLNSKFDKQELEKERAVVLQEIKMVEDTPDDLIHDLFATAFWKGHPLAMPVLGNLQTMSSLKRDDVFSYYKHAYLPHAVIITAAGNLEHKRLLRLLKPFEKMPVSKNSSIRIPQSALPKPSSGVTLEHRNLEQAHLCLGTPSPSQAHHDRYKIYILNTLLGGGMSSRLFQEIREKRGLAYSVYSYLNLCLDVGSLVVYAGCAPDSFGKVVKLILKELNVFARKEVDKKELKSAKEQLKGSMLLGLETSESRMTKLARDEIYFNRTVTIREIVEGIEKVTAKDIMKLAKEIFTPDKIALAAIGKVDEKGLPKILEIKGLK
ncbi:MAG: insulinase family protein [Deltaproteobacteria bacterium]|nr:insulinase family protein [Deltaproteobacteria bacterium]